MPKILWFSILMSHFYRQLFTCCCMLWSFSTLHAQVSDVVIDGIHFVSEKRTIDPTAFTYPLTDFYIQDVAKYHGYYFCLCCEESKDEDIYRHFYHVLAVRQSDFSISQVSMPAVTRISRYSQIFVRNDSLLIKGYYHDSDKDYCILELPANSERTSYWTLQETSPLSRIVYEDGDFAVTYTDMGEWGKYLGFIDQSNRQEHLYWGSAKLFRKSDGYYICGSQGIGVIVDPKDGVLKKSDEDYYAERASAPNSLFHHERHLFDIEGPDTTVAAYFMHKDTIYMFETDPSGSYLAKLDGHSAKRVKKLAQHFHYISNSSLAKNSDERGGVYLYAYSSKQGRSSGIMDIEDGVVKMISVHINQPPVTVTGTDGLEKTLAFVTKGFATKTIGDVEALERQLGSYCNTIPTSLNHPSESRIFYRIPNATTMVKAKYGYDAVDSTLNSLMLTWKPAGQLLGKKVGVFSKKRIRQEIISTITRLLKRSPQKDADGSLIWKSNGVTIDLWNHSQEVRLMIKRDD